MEELQAVLKALADDTRFKIVDLLLSHDFCVGALAGRLGVSEAAVSQHLQILRKTGLVKGEKRGYYTHYGVDRDLLEKVSTEIRSIALRKPEGEGGCARHAKGGSCHCQAKGKGDE